METLPFWILALGMAAAVAALLVGSYWQAGKRLSADTEPAPKGDAPSEDRQLYHDQLAEIERDLARGTIAQTEAQRLRAEVARRLIEAGRRAPPPPRRSDRSLWAAGLILVLLVPGAALVYGGFGPARPGLGAPGYPDMPLAGRIAEANARLRNRPSQAEAEASQPVWTQPALEPDYLELITRLREAVDPVTGTDPEGLRLLALNEARLGNFTAAITAQTRRITLLGEKATADDHASLADLLIGAAGGYVSPEAEEQLVAALTLDAQHPMARYYSGLLFAQVGRYDRAFQLWRGLADSGAADAPWMPALRAELPRLADLAGQDYTLPPLPGQGLRGPDGAAIAAAEGMEAGDRQAMIEGMVSQLSDRLATEGGRAAEWAQLINALGVLGRKDQAREIWTEAKTIFAADAAATEQLTQAAKAAGIAE